MVDFVVLIVPNAHAVAGGGHVILGVDHKLVVVALLGAPLVDLETEGHPIAAVAAAADPGVVEVLAPPPLVVHQDGRVVVVQVLVQVLVLVVGVWQQLWTKPDAWDEHGSSVPFLHSHPPVSSG